MAFSKDGKATKFVESLPGGGLLTAPVHAYAGNKDHAKNAAAKGITTGVTAAAGALGGPGAAAVAKVAFAALPKMSSNETKRVAIKSCHGSYLRAYPDGRIDCKPGPGHADWEHFSFVKIDDCKIGLKSHHNKYLCAEDNGSLVCNRDGCSGWEAFELLSLGENRYALKAWHGRYLTFTNGNTVQSNTDQLNAWEIVYLEFL